MNITRIVVKLDSCVDGIVIFQRFCRLLLLFAQTFVYYSVIPRGTWKVVIQAT